MAEYQPSLRTRETEVIADMQGTSQLSIERARDWIGLVRRMGVYADRERIGWLNNGETATFTLPAGRHSVHVQMDWKRSEALLLDMHAGETERLECGSTLKGWKLILMLFYVIS